MDFHPNKPFHTETAHLYMALIFSVKGHNRHSFPVKWLCSSIGYILAPAPIGSYGKMTPDGPNFSDPGGAHCYDGCWSFRCRRISSFTSINVQGVLKNCLVEREPEVNHRTTVTSLYNAFLMFPEFQSCLLALGEGANCNIFKRKNIYIYDQYNEKKKKSDFDPVALLSCLKIIQVRRNTKSNLFCISTGTILKIALCFILFG